METDAALSHTRDRLYHTSMQAPFILMPDKGSAYKCAHVIYNYVNVMNAPYIHELFRIEKV